MPYSAPCLAFWDFSDSGRIYLGIDNFADLGKGHPVTKALGEDGVVKMMATSGNFTQHIERRIIRLDPDLSFEVKATAQR